MSRRAAGIAYPLRILSLLALGLSSLNLGAVLLLWRPSPPLNGDPQIVYSSSIGQEANTYIIQAATGFSDRLLLAGYALTLSSCSVNGERLAFVSNGALHLVEVGSSDQWSVPLDAIPFRPVSLLAFNRGGVLVASRPGEVVYFQPGAGGHLEPSANPLVHERVVPMSPVERFRALMLARMTPDARLTLPLPSDAHTWDSTWSPDGRFLAYPTLIHGQAAIHLWDAGMGLRVQLTFMSGAEYRPTWSPDGQQIAFLADKVSYADFFTMRLDSAPPDHLFSTREIYPYLCFLTGRPALLLNGEPSPATG